MSRTATPLITPAPLPHIDDGIEVLLAEARLAYPEYGAEPVEGHYVSLLVMFDPDDQDRRAARLLAHSFMSAKAQFVQVQVNEEGTGHLQQAIQHLDQAMGYVVLALPDHSPEVESRVRSLLAELREHLQLCAVIGVARNPVDWTHTEVIDRFAMSEADLIGSTAIKLFQIVSSLMAPDMMPCIDELDLLDCLGTAETPTNLIEGGWNSKENRLILFSQEDWQIMSRSRQVTAFVLHPMSLLVRANLLKAIRSSANGDLDVSLVVASGLYFSGRKTIHRVPLFLVCQQG